MKVQLEEARLSREIIRKAARIRIVFTDCDGVLTDGGVFFSAEGEAMKRFSMRDGMGVERLRKINNVETIIITGEDSDVVRRRAEKLGVRMFGGIKDKVNLVRRILEEKEIDPSRAAFIGDDVNDLEAMSFCGLSAAPEDAFYHVSKAADIRLKCGGGHGAFRELAEIIILSKQIQS